VERAAHLIDACIQHVRCDAACGGNRGCDERRLGEWRQIDEDDAIGEPIGHILGDGECQARLADATGACQGEQRHGLVEEECSRGDDLFLTANEPRAGDGSRSDQRGGRRRHRQLRRTTTTGCVA
jgi:hypothetical protein